MNTRITTRFGAAGIATIAAAVSYQTQVHLLQQWGDTGLAVYAIPLTVDLLAIVASLGLHSPDIDQAGKRMAVTALVFAGTVSLAANAMVGGHLGLRAAHVWCVLAYLLAEGVAAKSRRTAPVEAPVSAVPAVVDRRTVAEIESAFAEIPAEVIDRFRSEFLPARRRSARRSPAEPVMD